MNYSTGEAPQINDAVLGTIEGEPARARVLAVRANGDLLLTRRASYSGPRKPLVAEHHEAPAEDFELVYRHVADGAIAPQRAAPPKGVKKAAGSGKK